MGSSSTLPIPEGPGSVSGAPNLPEGFVDTFTSQYVEVGDLRLHAVIGGDGPPLLLVHGWPQTWYQFRLLMPALARDFEVIAVDQRGIGLSDKPEDGYDTGTLADDVVGLMDALGHQRFALVGCDTGLLIGYAVAADHPDRVDRVALGEAPLPGISPPTPLILPDVAKAKLWHIAFNQQDKVNEQLVTGREDIFIGAEYAAAAGQNKLPEYAVNYYIDTLSNPDSLHGSFQMYRAFNSSAAQNEQRKTKPLTMPVLALAGDHSLGEMVQTTMKLVADDVQSAIFADTGHWIAEEAPDRMLSALTAFLGPYRDGSGATRDAAHAGTTV
jgi:pimeloyl-ACP methyl ester carboxylesterase